MNKEEILAKSRVENKNKDMYEQEVLKKGQGIAIIVTAILATLFCVIQIFVGGGFNNGLYALVLSGTMATFWVKWFKLKRRHELVMAFVYTIIVIALSACHIYDLITASAIL